MSHIKRDILEDLSRVGEFPETTQTPGKPSITIGATLELWSKARRVEVFYYMGDGKVVSEVVKDNQNER